MAIPNSVRLHGGSLRAFRRNDPWTGSEVAELLELREVHGLRWSEIAETLGRTTEAILFRYRLLRGTVADEVPGENKKESLERAYADRDARHQAIIARNEADAERGNLNFVAFNDPPPGRSALDKMRARA